MFVASVVVRTWIGAGASAAAGVVLLGLLLPGRARLAEAPAEQGVVRVLVANVRAANDDPAGTVDQIAGSGADVVVLTEVGGPTNQALLASQPVLARLPHRTVVRPVLDEAPRLVVLSAWPIAETGGESEPGVGGYLVDRPAGAFGVVAFHAVSPRSAADWAAGLRRAERVGVRAASLARDGVPAIAAGDLNATPGGHRSAELRRIAGFRRAKPILAPAGTYPAGLPGVLRLPIDAVFVSPGVTVTGWETLDLVGSDHAGLLVTVLVGGGGDRSVDGR